MVGPALHDAIYRSRRLDVGFFSLPACSGGQGTRLLTPIPEADGNTKKPHSYTLAASPWAHSQAHGALLLPPSAPRAPSFLFTLFIPAGK